MRFIKPDIQTVCLGQAASAAAVLLAAGTPGKRLALPNSRILIHQPYTEGTYGQTSDIEIQANEILRMRELLEKMIADAHRQDAEEVSRDIERDKILTAEAAVEYGLIDAILESRKGAPGAIGADPSRGVAVSCPHSGARRGTFESDVHTAVSSPGRTGLGAAGRIVRSRACGTHR